MTDNKSFKQQVSEDYPKVQALRKAKPKKDNLGNIAAGFISFATAAAVTIICLGLGFLAYYHQDIWNWVLSVLGG